MAGQRVFTLEEASALLPRLSAMVATQIEARTAIEERLAKLAEETGLPPEAVIERDDDTDAVRALKRDLIARLHDYQAAWNQVEDLGVVVKDPRIGLLDFYSRVDGKVVFLCWRYGEEAITHYHEIESGFAGRKPIAGALKTRLYN